MVKLKSDLLDKEYVYFPYIHFSYQIDQAYLIV